MNLEITGKKKSTQVSTLQTTTQQGWIRGGLGRQEKPAHLKPASL
jgi:hypothetical protein